MTEYKQALAGDLWHCIVCDGPVDRHAELIVSKADAMQNIGMMCHTCYHFPGTFPIRYYWRRTYTRGASYRLEWLPINSGPPVLVRDVGIPSVTFTPPNPTRATDAATPWVIPTLAARDPWYVRLAAWLARRGKGGRYVY